MGPMSFGFREFADLLFLGLLAFALVMTLIFYYHWARYAPSTLGSVSVIVVYSIGTLLLLLGMLGALAGI